MWGKLYACRSGTKAMCRCCGQVAVIGAYDEWILVPKR